MTDQLLRRVALGYVCRKAVTPGVTFDVDERNGGAVVDVGPYEHAGLVRLDDLTPNGRRYWLLTDAGRAEIGDAT